MKTILLLRISVLFLLIPFFFSSQVLVGDRTITINLDVSADSIRMPVKKQTYNLIILNRTKHIEKFFIDKKLIEYPALQDSTIKHFSKDSLSLTKLQLKFRDNTEYVIRIKLKEEPITRSYIFQSRSDWSWKTSFGANAVVLMNRKLFVNREGSVQENTDNNMFDLIPSVMFTFMNFQNNLSWGFTAGLGTDFKRISVFSGLSAGIGQNVIITGGIALHEQVSPDSDFFIGQKIEPTLMDDKLNKNYYRLNPFVGITFNLNSNPFKNKNSE